MKCAFAIILFLAPGLRLMAVDPPTYIGAETTQTLPGPAYNYRVIGNWPDSNSVSPLNPPVFKWIYDETIALTASNDVRLFHFQLSTNATPFSSTIWDIACSNNFYNLVPPITNADGSTYTGPCFWRIKYYDTNWTLLATGPTHYFKMAGNATLWDRSMLADTNHLATFQHPYMYFKGAQLGPIAATLPSVWDFHTLSISGIASSVVNFYQEQTWWGDSTITNGGENGAFLAIGGAASCAFSYYLLNSNNIYDVDGAAASLSYAATAIRQQNLDLIDPYVSDPGALQQFCLARDWLYPFMTTEERTNTLYTLKTLARYGAYGGACFYGDVNFTPTNRDYPYFPFQAPFYSSFKLGSSHPRHDVEVGLMACLAGMNEDAELRDLLPLFLNYSVFQLDPDLGDEGRGYSQQDNFKFDREFGAAACAIVTFPEAHLERNPLWTNLSRFFASWDETGYKAVFEGGDLGYGYVGQMYHYRYHDVANITGDGALLREYNREYNNFRVNSADEFPLLGEAFMNYYFTKPTETDYPRNEYFDPIRGFMISGSLPSSDNGAYTNGSTLFFYARPGGRNADHGDYRDGTYQFHFHGCEIKAEGAATGYAKHPMYDDSVLVNGIGTRTQISPPSDPVYSWFDHYTNCPEYTYASANITLAYNRTNFIQGGLGDQTLLYYSQITNCEPQVSLMRRHVFFPHKRYIVDYSECQTTTNSYFQWLYHIAQPGATIDASGCSFHYPCTNVYDQTVVTVYVLPFVSTGSIGLHNEAGTSNAKHNPFTGEDYMGIDDDTGPFVNNVIWITNRVATTAFHFGYVIYPALPGESAPTLTQRTDNSFDFQTATLHDGVSFAKTNTAIQALNLGTNYFILNTFDTTTNLIGPDSDENTNPGPTIYAPVNRFTDLDERDLPEGFLSYAAIEDTALEQSALDPRQPAITTNAPPSPAGWLMPMRTFPIVGTIRWDLPAYAVDRFEIETSTNLVTWCDGISAYTNACSMIQDAPWKFYRPRAVTPEGLWSELPTVN